MKVNKIIVTTPTKNYNILSELYKIKDKKQNGRQVVWCITIPFSATAHDSTCKQSYQSLPCLYGDI